MNKNRSLQPINKLDYVEELLAKGYIIDGPRQDPRRDLNSFKAFVKRGKEFAPEDWLVEMGYEFVEPNRFTQGHRIAYKMIDAFPDERFSSNYILVKGDKKIPLYLKVEVPDIEEDRT